MIIKKIIFMLIGILFTFSAFSAENSLRTTPEKGTVALTFDDGPSDIYTPQILAILKKYPDMVKLVLAEGHAINSHSLTHPMLTKLNNASLHKEVNEPQVIINNIIGIKPVCLRYPFGASNEHVRHVIRSLGIVPVPMGWNSFDYERPGTDKIVNWVLQNAHSGQVFLFHDGFNKREQTVAALPRIIEGIQKKGLGFSQICINKKNGTEVGSKS